MKKWGQSNKQTRERTKKTSECWLFKRSYREFFLQPESLWVVRRNIFLISVLKVGSALIKKKKIGVGGPPSYLIQTE